MPASFLHGIEVFERNVGPQPITIVKSAVIGLLGTAPSWAAPVRPSWYTPPVGARQPGTVDAASAWAAATVYALGAKVIDANGNLQQCTTAGTSGSSAPSWGTTLGGTTADNSPLVWTLLQVAWNNSAAYFYPLWNRHALYIVGDVVIDANGNLQQCTTAGESGATAPSWATTLGGATASDGSAAWKLVQLAAQVAQRQAMCLVSGANDASGFGPLIRGYTIPYALDAIGQQGAGQSIVVNVYDRNKHVTAVSAQSANIGAAVAMTVALGHMGVSNVAVVHSATTYVLGLDYTLDSVNGTITAKAGGALASGTNPISVSYNYANPADDTNGVVDADVIGAVSAGVYTGLQMLPLAYGQFGFFPKLLIAPSFSERQVVAAALLTLANKIRAMVLVDTLGGISPIGGGGSEVQTSKTGFDNQVQTPVVPTAIAYRGDTTKAFGLASPRVILCYPKLPFTDLGTDPAGATITNPTDGPMSAWMAGAIAASDLQRGYWFSPSNFPLIGPLGTDVPLYMSFTDANSDVNQLNAAGIVTVFSTFATGLLLWGNRSSAYPGETAPENFICIRRTLDVMEESVQIFARQYLDGPITNAFITAVLQSVNAFIRVLIQRGALEPGSRAAFDPTENPPVELANGHVTFDLIVMPPPPAERITFNVTVDTTLLANVTGASTQPGA